MRYDVAKQCLNDLAFAEKGTVALFTRFSEFVESSDLVLEYAFSDEFLFRALNQSYALFHKNADFSKSYSEQISILLTKVDLASIVIAVLEKNSLAPLKNFQFILFLIDQCRKSQENEISRKNLAVLTCYSGLIFGRYNDQGVTQDFQARKDVHALLLNKIKIIKDSMRKNLNLERAFLNPNKESMLGVHSLILSNTDLGFRKELVRVINDIKKTGGVNFLKLRAVLKSCISNPITPAMNDFDFIAFALANDVKNNAQLAQLITDHGIGEIKYPKMSLSVIHCLTFHEKSPSVKRQAEMEFSLVTCSNYLSSKQDLYLELNFADNNIIKEVRGHTSFESFKEDFKFVLQNISKENELEVTQLIRRLLAPDQKIKISYEDIKEVFNSANNIILQNVLEKLAEELNSDVLYFYLSEKSEANGARESMIKYMIKLECANKSGLIDLDDKKKLLAKSLFSAGNYYTAAPFYMNLQDKDPATKARHHFCATVKNIEDGDFSMAADNFAQSVQNHPDLPKDFQQQIYSLAFRIAKEHRAYEPVASLMTTLLSIYPDFADAYALRGAVSEQLPNKMAGAMADHFNGARLGSLMSLEALVEMEDELEEAKSELAKLIEHANSDSKCAELIISSAKKASNEEQQLYLLNRLSERGMARATFLIATETENPQQAVAYLSRFLIPKLDVELENQILARFEKIKENADQVLKQIITDLLVRYYIDKVNSENNYSVTLWKSVKALNSYHEMALQFEARKASAFATPFIKQIGQGGNHISLYLERAKECVSEKSLKVAASLFSLVSERCLSVFNVIKMAGLNSVSEEYFLDALLYQEKSRFLDNAIFHGTIIKMAEHLELPEKLRTFSKTIHALFIFEKNPNSNHLQTLKQQIPCLLDNFLHIKRIFFSDVFNSDTLISFLNFLIDSPECLKHEVKEKLIALRSSLLEKTPSSSQYLEFIFPRLM